ncbi:MAG: hypothetical protein H7343_05850 [Undibacterium sp.]|nr:hypothetical protein [Opitutaceae bacterium]
MKTLKKAANWIICIFAIAATLSAVIPWRDPNASDADKKTWLQGICDNAWAEAYTLASDNIAAQTAIIASKTSAKANALSYASACNSYKVTAQYNFDTATMSHNDKSAEWGIAADIYYDFTNDATYYSAIAASEWEAADAAESTSSMYSSFADAAWSAAAEAVTYSMDECYRLCALASSYEPRFRS